jgi:hypothetical protein
MMKRLLLAVMVAGTLGGCRVHVREPAYEYEYANVPPPPDQVEVMGVAPSPNHFWIPGHHYWSGGRYLWRPGYWEVRRHQQEWVPGHWEHHHGRGHYYVEGHWR